MRRVTLLFALCFAFGCMALAGVSLFGSRPVERPSREFDVLHYRIDIRFDVEKKSVEGTTTLRLTPLRSQLDSIALHAVRFEVKDVRLRNSSSAYHNTDSMIIIRLAKPLRVKDTVTVEITYSCTPAKGLYFRQPDSTNPARREQVWTQGEDMDNRHWFPCWDFPNDKATFEVIATVKENWTVLSNGALQRVTHNKAQRTKTFHWRQAKPHTSYLVMLAAGEYTVVQDKQGRIPIEYYLYTDRVEDGKRSLAATPRVMKFFEEKIGYRYPWEKYAQIFIEDFMWGGMENTGAVTLNTSYLIDKNGLLDFTADEVVAHELAHQWFGDIVTCRDWSELWLNEGFATYYESLYKKYAKGEDAFHHEMMEQQASILGVERAQGRIPIISNGSLGTNLYSKGAWVLRMLNAMLGDEEFDRAVLHFLRQNEFKSVSTFDLMKAIEETTGRNLDWFFRQWLYGAGHPRFNVSWTWSPEARAVTVHVEQTQTLDSLTGIFKAPVDIEVITGKHSIVRSFWVTSAKEDFVIPVDERPITVVFDKGMKILKSLSYKRETAELLHLLEHAGEVTERTTAAKALKDSVHLPAVFAALRRVALHDPFWGVRREAAMSLAKDTSEAMKEVMLELYNDSSSAVRTVAAAGLGKLRGGDVATFLEKICASDSSYLVRSAGLASLVAVDTVAALRVAHNFLHRDSYRHILQRAALNAFNDIRSEESLKAARQFAQLGKPADLRLIAISILAEAGESDSSSRSLMLNLVADPVTSVRRRAIRTLGMWGGQDSRLALEKQRAAESDTDLQSEIDQYLEDLRP